MGRKTLFLVFVIAALSFKISFAGIAKQEAEKYFKDGVKAQNGGDFMTAETMYQKALMLDPFDLKWQKYILNNRGVMYAKTGDPEKAEMYFNEALKIDPEYETPKLNLGFIYEKRRTKLESIEYWLKVLNINLDDVKPKGFVIEKDEPLGPKKN